MGWHWYGHPSDDTHVESVHCRCHCAVCTLQCAVCSFAVCTVHSELLLCSDSVFQIVSQPSRNACECMQYPGIRKKNLLGIPSPRKFMLGPNNGSGNKNRFWGILSTQSNGLCPSQPRGKRDDESSNRKRHLRGSEAILVA